MVNRVRNPPFCERTVRTHAERAYARSDAVQRLRAKRKGKHTGKPKWMSAASVRTLREEEIAMKATPPIQTANNCLNSELNSCNFLHNTNPLSSDRGGTKTVSVTSAKHRCPLPARPVFSHMQMGPSCMRIVFLFLNR